jgi:hypothetical protein
VRSEFRACPTANRISMTITIDDPKAYLKPWTVKTALNPVPDMELMEGACDNHEKTMEHRRITPPQPEPPSRLSYGFRIWIIMVFAAVSTAGQTPWTPPKTPWGDPDLQGIYTSDDLMDTPIEGPAEFGLRLYFTKEELAQAAFQLERRAKADLQEFVTPNTRVTTGPPSNWGERARRPPLQTSLIVDPPDGRLPPLSRRVRVDLIKTYPSVRIPIRGDRPCSEPNDADSLSAPALHHLHDVSNGTSLVEGRDARTYVPPTRSVGKTEGR